MAYNVRMFANRTVKEYKVEEGTNLLSFLRKQKADVSAPCGGKGTCGKCRVKVEGIKAEPSEKESKLLGEKWLSRGYRLACCNKIESNLDVYIDDMEGKASIVTQAKEREVKLEPIVAKKYVELAVPDIGDQKSDFERIMDTDSYKSVVSADFLRGLPETLRKSDFKVTCVDIDKKIIAVEAGNTVNVSYGLAVDIGTTTIAAYLIDMNSGKRAGVYSVLNPQRQFGADVISRINYTMESKNGLGELHKSIADCINKIVRYFTSSLGIKRSSIYAVTFAGNTTMMHFLMKVSAKNISVSPFIPVTTRLHKFKASELGIRINPNGFAFVLPGVSAYIGADTVAAVLSSGMYKSEKITLLIDLGTNGEIVLGSSKWMFACSAAAGPAFEGANIRNGMGGVEGAIDKISFSPEIKFSTIGGKKARGICGSGVVDAIAGLISEGIIDETGRLLPEDEAATPREDLKKRITTIDGMTAFVLSGLKKGEADIAITQKDVRELQNAKAAIAAGIRILVSKAGIRMEDIDRVYLAGGFGSYINIDSALRIGLIPIELKEKIEAIGNAAGSGAVEGLISARLLKKTEEIKDRIKYVELSGEPAFMNEYVECMMF
ncbi:MAG: ASKHA domain-containing protein [Clostridia bacterium]|nr:ASKHA domain-containing protein [Clostridia bacterium]